MLRRLAPIIVVILIVAFAMGCFVTTRSSGRAVRRDCPPSYHWEDGECVHNGRGHKKHKKHKHKKHR